MQVRSLIRPVALGACLLGACTPRAASHALDFEDAQALCMAVSSCLPGWASENTSFSDYCAAEWMGSRIDAEAESSAYLCAIAAHGDCEAVRACFAITLDPTCPMNVDRCDGDVLRRCDLTAGLPYVRGGTQDCAALGLSCLTTQPHGVARCGIAYCRPSTTLACLGPTVSMQCSSGVLVQVPCQNGTRCLGGQGCVPTGPACTEDACEGEIAVRCDGAPNGQLGARIDCAARGEQCSLTTVATCVQPRSDCTAATEGCFDGTTVGYCGLDGRPHTFDCVAHGYTGCATTYVGPLCTSGTSVWN